MIRTQKLEWGRKAQRLAQLPALCLWIALCWGALHGSPLWAKKAKKATPSPPEVSRDAWIADLQALEAVKSLSPGSLYTDSGRYGNLASDFRASRKGDLITVVVSDQSSAVSTGATASSRTSSASATVGSLFGNRAATDALSNLANLSGNSKLDGSGSTSRSNTLTATVSGRIVEVLPSGDYLIEAIKQVDINSEKQSVLIRGIVRWNDIGPANSVRSDRIGQMQLQVNGKGIVGDAIRRPNIVYRLLMGILPF